jgi:hypothetical protein
MASLEWYYTQGNEHVGPVTSLELKELARQGVVEPEHFVWHAGMEDWVPARLVRGLFDAVPSDSGKDAAPRASDNGPRMLSTAAVAPDAIASPSGSPFSTTPIPTTPELPETGDSREVNDLREAIAAFERSPAAFERARERKPRHLFDFFLETMRQRFGAPFIRATIRLFTVAGHYGLYGAIVLLLAAQIALSATSHQPFSALWGLVQTLVLTVLQYTAVRCLGVLDRALRAPAGKLASTAFLDSFAILSLFGGFAMLFGFAIAAAQSHAYSSMLGAVAGFILFQYMAVVTLCPEVLHLTIASDASAHEEALGVLAFFGRVGVRLLPVAFGLGVLGGLLWLVYGGLFLLEPVDKSAVRVADGAAVWLQTSWLDAQNAANEAFLLLAVSAACPLLGYVAFLFVNLLVEVLQTLLGVKP